MKFREMIKKVQLNSGFSDRESKDALVHLVESLAVRLTEGERKDFAGQLPTELQGVALSVLPTEDNAKPDLVEQFMQQQKISRDRAKKQILSAWTTLKEAISPGEIKDIRAQLPNKIVAFLH
jgi:uncharacterized protein (DUF2267 family)